MPDDTPREPVPVCKAMKPHSTWPWRCQLKAGHDPADVHMWPLESEHYNYPLDQYDADWLAKELRLQLYNLKTVKADHRAEISGLRARFGTLLQGLVQLAPGNSKRKNVPTAAVQELWQAAVN